MPAMGGDTPVSFRPPSDIQLAEVGRRFPARATAALWKLFWWDSSWSVKAGAFIRLGAIVLLQLFRGRAGVALSAARRQQIDAMLKNSGTDRRLVLMGLGRYVAMLLLLSPVNKLYWRLTRSLRQAWSRQLTSHFLSTFVEAQCLSYGTGGAWAPPDNDGGSEPASPMATKPAPSDAGGRLPDQRISHDVGTFVGLSLFLSLDLLEASINTWFNIRALRQISPALSKGVVLGALAGTASTRWLGRRMPALYEAERHADGDFVYSLTRLREHAESVAFYGGQRLELKQLREKLERRLCTEWVRFAWKDFVQLFSQAYRQVVGLAPVYLLVGRMIPPVAASAAAAAPRSRSQGHGHGHGHGGSHDSSHGSSAGLGTDVGLVNQARELFDATLSPLLVFAENTSDFARLSALAVELHNYDIASRTALERLQEPEAAAESPSGRRGRKVLLEARVENGTPAPLLQIERLSLWAPGHPARLLVDGLSLEHACGGLLISGPSGVGKTTLLRAIAGLWLGGDGVVRRELHPRRVLFLPQQPYMQLGTLREQLLYPFGEETEEPPSDAGLVAILERLDLGHVVRRVGGDLGAMRRWAEELSVGEQQRVSIARLLVHRPVFAILDETTAANDLAHERVMYACVAETCEAFVSVGHRASIESFHSRRLVLLGEREGGRWKVEEL